MTTIKMRRGTLAEWRAANPTPADGEICVERDTKRFRIGNASDSYLGLDTFVALPEITAAIEHERVTTATSWAALPASGNWLGRTIHIPSVKAFAYWDGTKWCIDPRSDTGWITVTMWDASGVVSGVPISTDIELAPYAGAISFRRVSNSLIVRGSNFRVKPKGPGDIKLWVDTWDPPVEWQPYLSVPSLVPQKYALNTVADGHIYGTVTQSHTTGNAVPCLYTTGTVSALVSFACDFSISLYGPTGDSVKPWPTSLAINYTPPAP